MHALHETHNVDNATTFKIWPNDKLRDAYGTNDFVSVSMC